MNYAYTDLTIAGTENVVYYRLHQFDYDGASEYSQVRNVNFAGELTHDVVNVYPNPFRSEVMVSVRSTEEENVTLKVINAQGVVVVNEQVPGTTNIRLNLSDWATGVYVIQVTGENTTHTKRIIKN